LLRKIDARESLGRAARSGLADHSSSRLPRVS
jgi:hypothetical protein